LYEPPFDRAFVDADSDGRDDSNDEMNTWKLHLYKGNYLNYMNLPLCNATGTNTPCLRKRYTEAYNALYSIIDQYNSEVNFGAG